MVSCCKKRAENYFKKYGVHNPSKRKIVIDKRRNTNLELYGVSCILTLPENRDKAINKLKEISKIYWRNTNKNDWYMYRDLVRKYTEKHALYLDNSYKRGKEFHLDHKYSIKEGFDNNIPIYLIANKNNLQIIEAEKNIKKNKKCSISIEELTRLTKDKI